MPKPYNSEGRIPANASVAIFMDAEIIRSLEKHVHDHALVAKDDLSPLDQIALCLYKAAIGENEKSLNHNVKLVQYANSMHFWRVDDPGEEMRNSGNTLQTTDEAIAKVLKSLEPLDPKE